ncbi:MAG: DNA gyrase inhibitor YacG, partial [Planctomycetes bacterium]|nr:DNA gyrase inhibitor YacG [Planctomycetota bacterium]
MRPLDKPATVKCPNCGRAVEWTDRSPFRPFCSDRCRLIDLGEWASERHRIEGDPMTDDDVS